MPQLEESVVPGPALSSTRRTTIKRLGLALLGGAVAATALGVPQAQAKIIANPTINGLTGKAGAIVLPPGAATPTGSYSNIIGQTYGLIASGTTTALDISQLPGTNIGVYGSGNYGVYGSGHVGVYGNSDSMGVWGSGHDNGVYGTGNNTGIYGYGNIYGVQGYGDYYGVKGVGQAAGVFLGHSGGGSGVFPASTTVGVIGSVSTDLDPPTIPANSCIGYQHHPG